MADCFFCRIASGQAPADVVLQDEDLLAFRDINPQAPVHVLIIPRAHYDNVAELAAVDPNLLGRLFAMAATVAQQERVDAGGYRLVANTGADGGQTVDHVHIHLLGGRPMGWPPG